MSERLIEPEKKYVETFDFSKRETIDYVNTLEYKAMFLLQEAGILVRLTKYHEQMKTGKFFFDKPLVYSFAFEVADAKEFYSLYELIFNEVEEDELVNPRTALDYNVKTGELIIRKSGNRLLKVNEGMKPDLVLKEIFVNQKEIVRIEEIPGVVIRKGEKMKHILKQKVYTSFLKFGSDYVRLKPKASRKELESYAQQ